MSSTAKLLNLAFELKGMKLGLERIRQIDTLLGSPSQSCKMIHVAGTNGKGSVSLKIALGLQRAGKRVGLFTSPHLHHISERICIDQKPISEDALEQVLQQLEPYEMTYFEKMTLAAFLYFKEQKVDYAVNEVGHGCTFDSTNIITPLLSVVTSIGLDHMQYLGESCEKIAFEKAGVAKEGIPLLLGPEAKPREVFERVAREKGAPLITIEESFPHFEEENRAVAKRALELLGFPGPTIEEVPSCRFEVVGSVVYDVAHNLPGMHRLFERLCHTFPDKKFRVVVAFSADKAVDEMLHFLKQRAVEVHLTRADHPRAAAIGELDLKKTFENAKRVAEKRGEILVVCGTFFMMSALRAEG